MTATLDDAELENDVQVIPVGTRSHGGAYEQHEYIILGAEPYSGVAKLLPETTKSDKQTGQPARISFWTVNSKEGEAQGCYPAETCVIPGAMGVDLHCSDPNKGEAKLRQKLQLL